MGWSTGISVYVMIWWIVLFAVLPIGAASEAQDDAPTGWRGAPAAPRLWKKVAITTVVAAVIWAGVWWLVQSPYLSFRQGWLALPNS